MILRIFMVVCCIAAGYKFFYAPAKKHPPVSFHENHAAGVVVYGRDTCGITRAVLRKLQEQGIDYSYRNIDNPVFSRAMWERIDQSGIDEKSFTTLPAVDVNRHMMVNVRSATVMEHVYRHSSHDAAP